MGALRTHFLSPIKQEGGKISHAWAVEADIDADAIKSNTFEMEWPPRSGKTARQAQICLCKSEIQNPQSEIGTPRPNCTY